MAWTTPKTWTPAEVVTAQDLNTHVRDNLLSVMPLGVVLPFAGATAPNSLYLICDGTAVSRTTYAELFALIGTTYGAGDGSTTFNLPDMRGRAAVGKGTHADVDTLADNEGEAVAKRTPKHWHEMTFDTSGGSGATPIRGASSTLGITNHVTTLAASTPKDAPAYLTLNYIIKALQT